MNRTTLDIPSNKSGRGKSLLDLPAELRDSIYTFTLVKEKLLEDESYDIAYGRHKIAEPALLQTCKQIRHETLPIFYRETIFRCQIWTPARCFLEALSWDKLGALRSVQCSVALPKNAEDRVSETGIFRWSRKKLGQLLETFRETPLRPDALLMSIRVAGEQRWRWVSYDEAENYEVKEVDGREVIVRK